MFLPTTQREWWSVVAIFPCAALIGLALWLVQGRLSWTTTGVVLAIALLTDAALLEHAGRSKRRACPHGLDQGRMGTVVKLCAPRGRVVLDGTSWAALSLDSAPLQEGERVYVHAASGLELHVSRTPPEARSA